ncbi:hypothetical protein K432DRAFT_7196 [Lepidopterella palustris CBS 459.81]|uniref:ARM repeat-containing protein n=1 Tax=Lepidopterella palustris CBS 459.81 TaxID=1314670 RepID=A0A8E2ED05_9PEZI|nr:hypothetical protein K432DRAFT_7196 [Lepidopterella palustris CBS 459.81]
MATITTPTPHAISSAFPSIPEIEDLIKTLYTPGSPKKIKEVDATLRVLQRSVQGWDMANKLLSSSDVTVRFFAASTFTVKLNGDSNQLSPTDSQKLLSSLIYWLIHLYGDSNGASVTKKLCSTLTIYFCKPISSWSQCIRTLVCSFVAVKPVLEDELSEYPSTWDLLPSLNDEQLRCILRFSMDLAEESKKMNKPADRSLHDRMLPNILDVEVILHFAIARGQQYHSSQDESQQQLGEAICNEALRCFLSWVFYAQQEFKDSPENLAHIQSVVELALSCLQLHVDDAIEVFSDILEDYPKFFTPRHQEQIWAEIMSPWGVEIFKNFDDETLTLARLVIAYAQLLLNSGRLYKDTEDSQCQQVLGVLHEMLKYPGYVGENDDVAPIVADFWSSYITTVDDEFFQYMEGDAKPAWIDDARAHTLLVIADLWPKLRFPPAEITKEWDDEAKKTFKVFRADARDLIQAAYEQTHGMLLDQFVMHTMGALGQNDWLEVEAALYCLNSIAECLSAESDERLKGLFSSTLFDQLAASSDIPPMTSRTAVEMVGCYNGFFLRNEHYLAPVLRFLFNTLAQPALCNSAAKSFAELCSSCRKSLTGELEAFFDMYRQFLGYGTAERFTKSKVLEGIAAIVEAIRDEGQKCATLQRLLQFVGQDAERAVLLAHEGRALEEGLVLALTALDCLASMGKAFQAPDDTVIDLERDQLNEGLSRYWCSGPGNVVQKQIVDFIKILTDVFGTDSEIIEEACHVLRSGYKEILPGPFVLTPEATIDFIVHTNLNTPRLPYVLETACIFLASRKKDTSFSFNLEAQRLLRHIVQLMRQLGHPRADPDISVGLIEVLQRIINNNVIVLQQEPEETLSGLFAFSIECIKGPDVLPKRAGCELWSDIFAIASNAHHPQHNTAREIVDRYAKVVTFVLIFNICGEVDASSLEYVSSSLRKMVQAERNARHYIVHAVENQPLFIEQAHKDSKIDALIRTFTEGVMRNGRNTRAYKETVKEFWSTCKTLAVQQQGQRYGVLGAHQWSAPPAATTGESEQWSHMEALI